MSRPDIILREKRISVYTGDNGDIGERDFELVTSDNSGAEADIKLNPDLANIEAGGGDGRWSEGDLKLNDKGDDIRVQITAGSGSRDDPDADRIWIDGGTGSIAIGDDGEDRIQIDGGTVDRHGEAASGRTRIGLYSDYNAGDPTSAFAAGWYANENLSSKLTGLTIGTREWEGAMVMQWGNSRVPGMLLAHGLFMLGNDDVPGRIQVNNGDGRAAAEIRGDRGNINVGGAGNQGSIALRDASGEVAGWIKVEDGDLVLTNANDNVAIRTKPGGKVEFPNMDDLP